MCWPVFVFVTVVLGFFIFKNFNPVAAYVAGVGSAAGLVTLFSTKSK